MPRDLTWALGFGPEQACEMLAGWQGVHRLHKFVKFHLSIGICIVPLKTTHHGRHLLVDLSFAYHTGSVCINEIVQLPPSPHVLLRIPSGMSRQCRWVPMVWSWSMHRAHFRGWSPSSMIWAVLSGPPQARELLADWQIIHALHKLVEFHKTVSVLVVPLELADHWRHFNVDLGLANGTTTVLIAEIEQLPPCSNVFCRNSPVRCHHGGGASVG
mmetsp:Transcript_49799/g.83465  ORF Transcript_49799/g.83465 Transcript_49799/m.83465 type:complete len:214 (+) Transcript_49799:445-1086(+)